MRSCFLTALAALLLAWPPLVKAEDLSPSELLDRYEQTLEMFHKATFRVRVQSYSDWPGTPQGGPYRDDTYHTWRDGDRWKQIESSLSRSNQRGKVRVDKEGHEILYPEKGSISVRLDVKGHPTGVLASLQELSVDERRRISHYQVYSVVINGGMDFNRFPLPETLRESQLSAQEVQLDGRRLWLLEGSGSWGYHALWLDPRQGFLPRRILQRKQGQDKLFWGTDRITTVDSAPPENYGPWKQATHQLDVTRFGVANGKSVITALLSPKKFRWQRALQRMRSPTLAMLCRSPTLI